MWENAYLSIKNPKASRALKWALDPSRKWLASLTRLCFTTSATFGLRTWAPPWPNPGSAPVNTFYVSWKNHIWTISLRKLSSGYLLVMLDIVVIITQIEDSVKCHWQNRYCSHKGDLWWEALAGWKNSPNLSKLLIRCLTQLYPLPPRNYRRASGLATSNPVPLPIPIIGPSHGETFLEIMLYTATLPSGYGSGRPEPKVL